MGYYEKTDLRYSLDQNWSVQTPLDTSSGNETHHEVTAGVLAIWMQALGADVYYRWATAVTDDQIVAASDLKMLDGERARIQVPPNATVLHVMATSAVAGAEVRIVEV